MLTIREVETGYSKKQVLFGLSMDVRMGEIVALIGPNGSGKSTVLKTVSGLIPAWKGEMNFNSEPINGTTPAQNIAKGITFAPQGGRVFHNLTVMENLEVCGCQLSRRVVSERIESILEFFPALRGRVRQDAGRLSGGEQQLLALARVLVPQPKLLMLDEPSLGLSPNLGTTVFEKIVEISQERGMSILIVEQKVREVLQICSRVYSMKLGRMVFEGPPDDLKHDKEKLKALFL